MFISVVDEGIVIRGSMLPNIFFLSCFRVVFRQKYGRYSNAKAAKFVTAKANNRGCADSRLSWKTVNIWSIRGGTPRIERKKRKETEIASRTTSNNTMKTSGVTSLLIFPLYRMFLPWTQCIHCYPHHVSKSSYTAALPHLVIEKTPILNRDRFASCEPPCWWGIVECTEMYYSVSDCDSSRYEDFWILEEEICLRGLVQFNDLVTTTSHLHGASCARFSKKR